LVQLQRDLKSIDAAGIEVVAISYDSTAALKTFSDRAQIGFPLLSDPESKMIDAYHIRNPSARGKAVGVPNPGTFILDEQGIIRAKLFLDGFRERHTTEALITAAKAVKRPLNGQDAK
jgi:peroxiredoxin Q/BCP